MMKDENAINNLIELDTASGTIEVTGAAHNPPDFDIYPEGQSTQAYPIAALLLAGQATQPVS